MIALNDPAPGPAAGAPPPGRSIAELTRTVSASRLSTWQQCRRKFAFQYIEGVVKPVAPALHVGVTVHAVWNTRSNHRGARKLARGLYTVEALEGGYSAALTIQIDR